MIQLTALQKSRVRGTLVATLVTLAAAAQALAGGTLDKVHETGTLTLGYRADARPFSYTDESGKAAGYTVELCRKIADTLKAELKLVDLKVNFVPIAAANRFEALQQGQIDLQCGTATPTLSRRASVDFSIPIFQAGVGAVMRQDTAKRLRDALANAPDPSNPTWRGSPGQLSEKVVLAVIGGSTVENSLIDALKTRRIVVTVTPVPDYATGLQMVLDRRAGAFFGDRPVLLDAAKRAPKELHVVERSFTTDVVALALRRDDAPFRLFVDRTLSRLYRSSEFRPIYTAHFGEFDDRALTFFQLVQLPE